MALPLTDALCTHCGLCCDGTLFSEVELGGPGEATRLEALGLAIEEDDRPLLLQPCAGLAGRRCSVYAHRPGSCRTFECRLLQDVRSGTTSVPRALATIRATLARVRRIRGLLARLGRNDWIAPLEERCADALTSTPGVPPARSRTREALERHRLALRRIVASRFLGRPATAGSSPAKSPRRA